MMMDEENVYDDNDDNDDGNDDCNDDEPFEKESI